MTQEMTPESVVTVTLPEPDIAVVFSDDGAVFYRLDALVRQITTVLNPQIEIANETGDPIQTARCEGALWVRESIEKSIETLTLERQFVL